MSLWRRVFEERKRIVLPLVIVLVANVAVLVLAIFPLRASVRSAEAAAVDATVELAQARRLSKQATDARASRERADAELKRFYGEVLPGDRPTATKTVTFWLQQAALDAGLTIKGARSSWAEVRDSRLARVTSTLTLQGRYANIRRFLYELERAQEFVVVERVELAQSSNQPAAGGVLEVSLVVSTSFLMPGS